MDKAEESGYSGPITEEMIMEEMTTEAVETISTKHMQIQLGENVATWREGHKSKVARRHRGKFLQKDVFRAWTEAMEEAKSADGGDWVAKHQIKLKMRKMFRALMEDALLAWAHVTSTRKVAKQRQERIWRDWLQVCFTEFREACSSRRGARSQVVETMQQHSRRLRAVPFQAWHIYTVESRVWRHAIQLYTEVADRRRMQTKLRVSFAAWKMDIFQHSADEQQQLAETIRQLQSANEALQAAGTNSVEQAEVAVRESEKQLEEKEARAVAAEQDAQQKAIELENAQSELLKLQAQLEQKDILLATKTSAPVEKLPPPPPAPTPEPEPEPKNPSNSEVTYEELLLLNRAKWALGEFDKPVVYTPPATGGDQRDDELRRLNTIVDIFTSGKRQQVAVPPGVRLPPVKPPSREALPPENTDLKWDEFLTGLDQVRQKCMFIEYP